MTNSTLLRAAIIKTYALTRKSAFKRIALLHSKCEGEAFRLYCERWCSDCDGSTVSVTATQGEPLRIRSTYAFLEWQAESLEAFLTLYHGHLRKTFPFAYELLIERSYSGKASDDDFRALRKIIDDIMLEAPKSSDEIAFDAYSEGWIRLESKGMRRTWSGVFACHELRIQLLMNKLSEIGESVFRQIQ